MEFEVLDCYTWENMKHEVRGCEDNNHIQQIAYSSYEDIHTQVCFTCKKVRTTRDIELESELKEVGR